MMKGIAPNTEPVETIADRSYDSDQRPFGVGEMPEERITADAAGVAILTLGGLAK
jgi:hypothetical protein